MCLACNQLCCAGWEAEGCGCIDCYDLRCERMCDICWSKHHYTENCQQGGGPEENDSELSEV